jgi:hypothetical protein
VDDIVAKPKTSATAAEMERRRKVVRQADANNRLEGVFRDPATDAIVEAFVRGDIDVSEMVPLFKALPDPI